MKINLNHSDDGSATDTMACICVYLFSAVRHKNRGEFKKRSLKNIGRAACLRFHNVNIGKQHNRQHKYISEFLCCTSGEAYDAYDLVIKQCG